MNATNGTVDAELLAFCERHHNTPYVYAGALPLWCFMLVEWAWAVCWRHAQVAVDLHRLMLFVPLLQVAHCSLSIAYYLLCPWESVIEQIVAAAWVIATIGREPVMIVCLLLVAKGWGITRRRMGMRELAVSAVWTTLLYAAVVVYFAIGSIFAAIPMLVVWVVVLVGVLSAVLTNLRVLKAQLLALRSFNIDATTTPVYTKYRMYQKLLVYTTLYYTADLGLYALASARVGPAWATVLARQVMEASTALLIGYAFRARPFNVLFEHVRARAPPSPRTDAIAHTALKLPCTAHLGVHPRPASPLPPPWPPYIGFETAPENGM